MELRELKRLMAERNEKGAGLARLLNLTPDKFSKALNGKRRFTAAETDILRRYFYGSDHANSPVAKRLPIVGLVSAGKWAEGFEHVLGYMPSPDVGLSDDAFVVIVDGDSMDLIARPGDKIIVEPADRHLIAGKLYVVRNGDGETTFKRYMESPARLEPCSTNSAHPTLYPGQDGFEVIGRAIHRVSDL